VSKYHPTVTQRHLKDETPKHKVVVRVYESEANKSVHYCCRWEVTSPKVKQRHSKDETPKHKVVVRVVESEANKSCYSLL